MPRASSVRLQGTLEWEEVWQALIESAKKFNLMKIRLNLYLPQLHEDFFATWTRRSTSRADRRWSAEIPLVVDDAVVGTLSVVGVQDGGSVAPVLSAFAELVEPVESQLAQVLDEHQKRQRAMAMDGDDVPTSVEEPERAEESPVTT